MAPYTLLGCFRALRRNAGNRMVLMVLNCLLIEGSQSVKSR